MSKDNPLMPQVSPLVHADFTEIEKHVLYDYQRSFLRAMKDAEETGYAEGEQFDPYTQFSRNTYQQRGKSRMVEFMKEALLDAGYNVVTLRSDGTVERQGPGFARDITPRAGTHDDTGRHGRGLLPGPVDAKGEKHRDD